MIERLDPLLDTLGDLQTKLLLLIGPPRGGKTALLRALGARRQLEVLPVGTVLGRQLLSLPATRRHLMVAQLLGELAERHAADGLVLMDNIELLFDRSLQTDPIGLLRRQAHLRRVVVAWPGELTDGRISYGKLGHPEYLSQPASGFVPFEVGV